MAKKPSNRLVRKAIREIMEPKIREMGFAGRYPSFKRISKNEIHFLQFSVAKYGGSFTYNIGWCENRTLRNWDGADIAADDITIAHLPFENRHSIHRMIDAWRLDQTPLRCTVGGYDYDTILEDAGSCRDLVSECAETLLQAEKCLKTHKSQDAVHPVGHRVETGLSAELNAQMLLNKDDLRLKMLGDEL